MRDPLALCLIAAWAGLLLLPWYAVESGFWSFAWLGGLGGPEAGSAVAQAALNGRLWLWPVIFAFFPPLFVLARRRDDPQAAAVLIASGGFGLLWFFLQGFSIGLRGWNFASLEAIFGPVEPQAGMGYGALVAGASLLFLLTTGLARRGTMRGDVFVVSSIGLIVASIGLFVFFPVARVLAAAALGPEGGISVSAFLARLTAGDIWTLSCLAGGRSCGVFWNSLLLAAVVGVLTTLLGLAFALLAHRTRFRAKRLLKVLTVLPVVTPPFVIGLGIILLFGRSGVATGIIADWFGVRPGRWIYGFNGLVLVQVLAFTPIAFLVLSGVVQGVSASMEEAAQTLRADRWRTFRTVTWPLMRPGLANAFLIGFIESLADFGNPLVLGGNFDVLSTDIFFAVVGSQNDPGRAAALAIVLLSLLSPPSSCNSDGSAGAPTRRWPARAIPACLRSCRSGSAASSMP